MLIHGSYFMYEWSKVSFFIIWWLCIKILKFHKFSMKWPACLDTVYYVLQVIHSFVCVISFKQLVVWFFYVRFTSNRGSAKIGQIYLIMYTWCISLTVTETSAEPSLQAKQLQLKRARLADDLNDKISHRPGPIELVHKNILSVSCPLQASLLGNYMHPCTQRRPAGITCIHRCYNNRIK